MEMVNFSNIHKLNQQLIHEVQYLFRGSLLTYLHNFPSQTWFCVFIYSSVFCLCCIFAYVAFSGLGLRIIIVIFWVFFSVGNKSGVALSTYRIRLLTSYSRFF